MKRKIFLHGPLKKLAPNGLELHADTVAEAINGVGKQLKIKANVWHGRPTFKVLGCDTVESILGPSTQEELHIVPAFLGGGGGSTGSIIKIVIGVILIALAIAFPVTLGFLMGAGIGLVLGGLMGLLFPAKTANTGSTENHYLQASGNTVQIGTRIQLAFGEVKILGQILSYNIDALES